MILAACGADGPSGPTDPPPGDPPTTSPLVAVSDGHLFETLDVRNRQTCAVTVDGDAYCWGETFGGHLGDGATAYSRSPVLVAGGHRFSKVSVGFRGHACGLTTDGDAYCWGFNEGGQLGDGTTTDSAIPVMVSGGHRWLGVSAGGFQSCGVTMEGLAHCWGQSPDLERGDTAGGIRSTPVHVRPEHEFSSISAGQGYTCGVTTLGDGYCWGRNYSGELGNGERRFPTSFPPMLVLGGLTFADIQTGGGYYSCGVTVEGAGYCWGWNEYGGLGDGSTTDRLVPNPVSGSHRFSRVSPGYSHTCGVTVDGEAYCWGLNEEGKLGVGPNAPTSSLVPTLVSGGYRFLSVSAGFMHGCGVAVAGDAYCWGDTTYRQPGLGF